mmetsp:Transcript_2600/g.5286  ORF Transcript_2600/g.5286 Transcript_2600/m.5286 type:complete len:236 (-) Transcript_2600:223-930(-)
MFHLTNETKNSFDRRSLGFVASSSIFGFIQISLGRRPDERFLFHQQDHIVGNKRGFSPFTSGLSKSTAAAATGRHGRRPQNLLDHHRHIFRSPLQILLHRLQLYPHGRFVRPAPPIGYVSDGLGHELRTCFFEAEGCPERAVLAVGLEGVGECGGRCGRLRVLLNGAVRGFVLMMVIVAVVVGIVAIAFSRVVVVVVVLFVVVIIRHPFVQILEKIPLSHIFPIVIGFDFVVMSQ